jgi:hypothetical protein
MQRSLEADLAYAAGVVDSDGYIGVHRSDYAMRVRGDAGQVVYMPRIAVKQVTPEAVDMLHELFGGHRYNGKPSAARGRPLLVWSVHSRMAGATCERLLPYLRIKRAQAENAIEVCRINSEPSRRKHLVPDVVDGEPLLPLLEAARLAGRSESVAYQSSSIGNIPTVRVGRRVLVPESFVETWRTRPDSPGRRADLTVQLEACFRRAKELNHVGV